MKVPVTERALVQRLNRKTKRHGFMVRSDRRGGWLLVDKENGEAEKADLNALAGLFQVVEKWEKVL